MQQNWDRSLIRGMSGYRDHYKSNIDAYNELDKATISNISEIEYLNSLLKNCSVKTTKRNYLNCEYYEYRNTTFIVHSRLRFKGRTKAQNFPLYRLKLLLGKRKRERFSLVKSKIIAC